MNSSEYPGTVEVPASIPTDIAADKAIFQVCQARLPVNVNCLPSDTKCE